MKRLVAAVLALPVVATAGTAQAATCNPKVLQGLWVGHATFQVDLYCLVDVARSGKIVQSSCFAAKSLKPTASLDGKFALDGDCKVSGNFDLTVYKSGKVSPATFKGRLNTDKELMNGDFVIFGASEDYRFVKQLD